MWMSTEISSFSFNLNVLIFTTCHTIQVFLKQILLLLHQSLIQFSAALLDVQKIT